MVGSLRRSRGYTLVEAILASFLLVSAFFIVAKMFHTGLQYSSRAEQRMTAVYLAEKRMAEVREWGKNQTDWTGWPTGNDSAYPAYDINVRIEDRPVRSPCTSLEMQHPAGDRRRLAGASKNALVEVTWGRNGLYRLCSSITEDSATLRGPQKPDEPWKKAYYAIDISGAIPDPVRDNVDVTLRARLFDQAGNEIPDTFFHWNVEPVYDISNPTMGVVRVQRRDGKEAIFRNNMKKPDGNFTPTTGQVKVVCYALYYGEIAYGETRTINLAP